MIKEVEYLFLHKIVFIFCPDLLLLFLVKRCSVAWKKHLIYCTYPADNDGPSKTLLHHKMFTATPPEHACWTVNSGGLLHHLFITRTLFLFYGFHQSTVRCILPLPACLLLPPSSFHLPAFHSGEKTNYPTCVWAHCVQVTQSEISLGVLNEIQMSY